MTYAHQKSQTAAVRVDHACIHTASSSTCVTVGRLQAVFESFPIWKSDHQ
jgi:hypothetical protein